MPSSKPDSTIIDVRIYRGAFHARDRALGKTASRRSTAEDAARACGRKVYGAVGFKLVTVTARTYIAER